MYIVNVKNIIQSKTIIDRKGWYIMIWQFYLLFNLCLDSLGLLMFSDRSVIFSPLGRIIGCSRRSVRGSCTIGRGCSSRSCSWLCWRSPILIYKTLHGFTMLFTKIFFFLNCTYLTAHNVPSFRWLRLLLSFPCYDNIQPIAESNQLVLLVALLRLMNKNWNIHLH